MKFNKLVATAALVTSLSIGWFGHTYYISRASNEDSASPIRENSGEYKYIDPLLVIDNAEEKFPELNPLKDRLGDYISEAVSNKNASQISVYFRDLKTIKWTGVNENELYSPGSMLKITTLITYLKLASKNPDILKEQMYYDFKDEAGQYYKPVPLKAGYYPVLALLQQMIMHSDNSAMQLLDDKHIDQILKIYDELKIPNPLKSPQDFMSTMQYSRLFRLLYNSTYLSRSYSEQALHLLTYTGFNKGIIKELPPNIEVAHKFGEQTFLQDGALQHRELHDCGIVYYPDHPYVICIMTKGQDFDKLEKIIADLSKITFDYQSVNTK